MKRINYRAICLEPVHIGTGEYQLGRVDNTIVREPATGIPKIPGTSLAGIFRAHSNEDYKILYGGKDENGSNKMIKSKLSFSDARVVYFPVKSNLGTVWITTRERLKETGALADNENIHPDEDKVIPLRGIDNNENIALGWLYLQVSRDKISGIKAGAFKYLPEASAICCVSDKLFYHIVNDNLEVRTSVKINEGTGTADKGGLFTSEALPRGTILDFSIILTIESEEQEIVDNLSNIIGRIELLGLGGMKTRGFGRVRIKELGVWNDKS